MDVIPKSAQGDSAQAAQQNNEVKNFSLDSAQGDCLFKSLLIAYGLSLSIIFIIVGSAILGFLRNGAGIYKINLAKAIGENLAMSFMLDSPQFKAFSLFKNRKIFFSYHPELCAYKVSDRQISILLPRCSDPGVAPAIPGFTGEDKIGTHVSIKEFKKLKTAAESSSYPPYSILRLYNHQLITIQLPGLCPYVIDLAAYRESTGKPDVSLKSFSLLMVPGDEIQLSIFKRNRDYWLKAEAEIALGVTFEIFEPMIVGHE